MERHQASPDRLRVLVVDGDLAQRLRLALLLAGAGHAPTAVASVDRALEHIAARDCDLVITDLALPGRSGLVLLAELNRRAPTVPAFAMAAGPAEQLRRTASELGALAVLRKPVAAHILRAALASAAMVRHERSAA